MGPDLRGAWIALGPLISIDNDGGLRFHNRRSKWKSAITQLTRACRIENTSLQFKDCFANVVPFHRWSFPSSGDQNEKNSLALQAAFGLAVYPC